MSAADTFDWTGFWEQKAHAPTDFDATGRSRTDIVGFLYTIEEVVRLLEPQRTDRLLDVGCGTGLFTLALAPWVQNVDGVDISPAMVDRSRANTAGLSNVAFGPGTMTDLSAVTGPFQRVLAYSVVQYLRDEDEFRAALAELARVLAPGGRALLAANPDPARRPAYEARIPTHPDPKHVEREKRLLDHIFWLPPARAVALAADAGLRGRAEPLRSEIWQHFYMYNLVLDRDG